MQAERHRRIERVSLRERLFDLAYAKDTTRNYRSGVNNYLKHAQTRDSPFPIWSGESIAAWLLHAIFNLKWKKNTLKTRLNAVAWQIAVVRQEPWDTTPGSFVHLMRRTIARLGSDAEPKLPIKIDRLAQIMCLLNDNDMPASLLARLKASCGAWRRDAAHASIECAAWFALSFACFFRASETRSLREEDVHAEVNGDEVIKMQVSLRTSQFAIRKTSTSTVHLILNKLDRGDANYATCAVMRVCTLLLHREQHPEGKLFRISEEDARKSLKILAAYVFQLDARKFGLHSLRSGAACTADEAGAGIARIMFMGRWRSAAVLAYLRGDADGASALLLRGRRPGQMTAQGEYRVM